MQELNLFAVIVLCVGKLGITPIIYSLDTAAASCS